jgi:hypothetical protein
MASHRAVRAGLPRDLPGFPNPTGRAAHDGAEGSSRSIWRQALYPSKRLLAVLCQQRGFSRGITRMSDLPRLTLLEELDARQDDLLAELDRLNARLEQVLRECLSDRALTTGEPLAKAA